MFIAGTPFIAPTSTPVPWAPRPTQIYTSPARSAPMVNRDVHVIPGPVAPPSTPVANVGSSQITVDVSTPVPIGTVTGHVPVEVAGDVITDNGVRSTRWFVTGFDGAGASDFYTAIAIHTGKCADSSAGNPTLASMLQRIRTGFEMGLYAGIDAVFCPEQCPTTGRFHVHGAIKASKRLSRRQIQAILQGPWDCRPMKGTYSQARNYAIKNGGMAVYLGNPTVWDPVEVPLRRANPIDWAHVIQCCNTCRSFKAFKRRYIDQGDDDCTR